MGRRITRPSPSWLKEGRAALIGLSQSVCNSDWKAALGNSCQRQKVPPQGWKLYLQLCRHRCSSWRLKTYSAGLCLARNSSESLPLTSQLLRPSVSVLTIFGNENQRGQWFSSRGGAGGGRRGRRLVLIYNPYFKPRPRILKLTSFIYFALTEHTTEAVLPRPTSRV